MKPTKVNADKAIVDVGELGTGNADKTPCLVEICLLALRSLPLWVGLMAHIYFGKLLAA